MARGYPDFYGQETVPKYGSPNVATKGATPLATGNWGEVFSILGKGRTYGGYIYIFSTNDIRLTGSIRVTIDDEVFTLTTANIDMAYGLYQSNNAPVTLIMYYYNVTPVATSYYVAWAVNKDWTFTKSFKIEVFNGCGINATFRGQLYWSLVA